MHAAPPGQWFRRLGPRRTARTAWAYAASAALAAVPRIRNAVAGADPNRDSARAAIYVTHDRYSLVADYVVAQVAALAALGCRVTVISNAPKLRPEAVERLGPHVREIVHRHNFGHDFGAFKDGIARLGDLGALHSLILMNDSCYGPFLPLSDVETRAEASGCDLFGITDSWTYRYHLQTYFLIIGARVLGSPAFAAFWRTLLIWQPRSMVITRGEVRFTHEMLKAGFRAGALCPYARAAQLALARARGRLAETDRLLPGERRYYEQLAEDVSTGKPLNPTHSFWDVLITECGAPFVKRELLRRNPVRVPGLLGWETLLAGHNADLDAVCRHLQLG